MFSSVAERRGFLRNPHSLPRASRAIHCQCSLAQTKLGQTNLVNVLRRDGDSNPGNPFGVYTLSRRASSTTRASLHCALALFPKSATKLQQFIEIRKFFCNYFYFYHILPLIFAYFKKKQYLCNPKNRKSSNRL